MQVSLESTNKIVELEINGARVQARIWQGHTAKGIACHAYITRITVATGDDASEFDAELQEHAAPTPEVASIPLSMIL